MPPAPPSARSRFDTPAWRLAGIAVILAAIAYVFAPSVHGQWVWDDDEDIVNNVDMRSLAGLGRMWVAPQSVNYWPLRATFQWVMWQAWGDHPTGFHVVNLCFHALGALLLWRLLHRLGLRFAFWGALIFALHPLTVESVAWVTELKNTSSLPFLLLASLAWLRFDEVRDAASPRRRGRGWQVAAVLGFAAAMLCKSSVVMFPCVVLLFAWWRRGKITWQDLREAAPLFLVSLGFGLTTVWFEYTKSVVPTAAAQAIETLTQRSMAAGMAIWFYAWKSLWPVTLMPIYPRWDVRAWSLWHLLPWIAVAAVVFVLWRQRGRWGRGPLFAVGFFLLNLWPALGFIPMAYARFSWVADHFAYVGLIGIIALIVGIAGHVWPALPRGARLGCGGAALAVILLLGAKSRVYAAIYEGPETLWTYAIAKNPGSWTAHNNLGYHRYASGRPKDGLELFQTAIRLNPNYPDAYNNLGVALDGAGRRSESARYYLESIRLNPRNAAAHNNLAETLLDAGKVDEAIPHYETALKLAPRYPAAHHGYGKALGVKGRIEEALPHLAEAAFARPDSALFHYDLGNALILLGRVPLAKVQFEEALRVNPNYAEAHNNLANALFQLGFGAQAIPHYEAALRVNPNYPDAQKNYAYVRKWLAEQGKDRGATP